MQPCAAQGRALRGFALTAELARRRLGPGASARFAVARLSTRALSSFSLVQLDTGIVLRCCVRWTRPKLRGPGRRSAARGATRRFCAAKNRTCGAISQLAAHNVPSTRRARPVRRLRARLDQGRLWVRHLAITSARTVGNASAARRQKSADRGTRDRSLSRERDDLPTTRGVGDGARGSLRRSRASDADGGDRRGSGG